MDSYAPRLMEHGLKAMIGKGQRSPEVIEAMKRYRAVYFAAIGGAGAMLAQCVKKTEIIAYEDLGPEAIRLFTVEMFPVVVINDLHGHDLYQQAVEDLCPCLAHRCKKTCPFRHFSCTTCRLI